MKRYLANHIKQDLTEKMAKGKAKPCYPGRPDQSGKCERGFTVALTLSNFAG